MTARFNTSGAKTLLLNSLPVDKSLDILLETKKEEKAENKRTNINNKTKNDFSNDVDEELKAMLEADLDINFLENYENVKLLPICPDLDYYINMFISNYNILAKEKETEFLTSGIMDSEKKPRKEIIEKEKLLSKNLDAVDLSICSDDINIDFNKEYKDYDHQFQQNNDFDFETNLNNKNEEEQNEMNIVEQKNEDNYLITFKNFDLADYISNFGKGSKETFKNMPLFKKNFDNLDSLKPLIDNKKLNNSFNVLGEETKKAKVKKTENLFSFNLNEEVKEQKIFDSKIKNNKDKDKNNLSLLKERSLDKNLNSIKAIYLNINFLKKKRHRAEPVAHQKENL